MLAGAAPAAAQLRIVDYNTKTGENPGQQTARPEITTVLQAIGLQSAMGIAKPIDILLLQEQFSPGVTTQSFVDVLNNLYDPINKTMYARSTLDALTSDFMHRAGGPGMVYNTQTVEKIEEIRFGTVSTSAQPRSTMRYKFHPKGYGSDADFYAYNDHYKASGGDPDDMARRQIEALSVHNNANGLGPGKSIIFAGDFNINSSGEQMYQTLLSAGDGQAEDPINASGTPGVPATYVTWLNNSAYKSIHTQDPSGQMDDRFDFQLVSGELRDGEGMSIINGTYRAFGNNGTHTFNGNITTGTGASAAVLTALRNASDHLPVVADYQLPAKMGVDVASIPSLVVLGSVVPIDLTVSNIAPAVAAIGVDELDYTLSVTGDLTGGASGMDMALGGGNSHTVMLDTSTVGMKNGSILVSSSSQNAADAMFSLPVSFQVISGFLAADFNEDGAVDDADLNTWTTNFGLTSGATKDLGDANGDGSVDGADWLTWQEQEGSLPEGGTATAVVAEPGGGGMAAMWLMGIVGALRCGGPSRRG